MPLHSDNLPDQLRVGDHIYSRDLDDETWEETINEETDLMTVFSVDNNVMKVIIYSITTKGLNIKKKLKGTEKQIRNYIREKFTE